MVVATVVELDTRILFLLHATQRCCADSAFTPDETNVWRFELSEAGERKMYRDGVLLFTSNGLPGLPVGNYSKLNVGNSGCCGTFPGSIKDISIWLGIP